MEISESDKTGIKYWTKHGKIGMMGKFGNLSPDPRWYYKNSSNAVCFDVSLTPLPKTSYAYITESDFLTIPKKEIKSKYILNQIVSNIDDKFLSVRGNKYKEFRNVINRYKGLDIKESPESLDEVLTFINEWEEYRGDAKYGWQMHTGYDKSFFERFYGKETDIQCLFFYQVERLVGFSVISIDNPKEPLVYMLGKNDTRLKGLSLYIDFISFKKLYEKFGKVLINWGASSGSLLSYKRKFPIYTEDKLYFFRKVL